MLNATPPNKSDKADATQPKPPDQKFWERYSPRYEFPISTVATIALHAVAIAIIIYIVWHLSKDADTVPPVPIRDITVQNNPGSGGGEPGSGGGDPKVEANDDRPPEQQPVIPEVVLNKRMVAAAILLDIKDPEALKAIAQSPNFKQLDDINDDLKKQIAKGFVPKPGAGDNPGPGTTNDPGTGPGGSPGPSTSGSRSSRWTIVFRTNSGEDYLKQLHAYEAKIVIPQPPDWKRNVLFDVITEPNPGKPLRDQDLPEMYFKDADAESAAKVARALGLNFRPPYFIAFFPKHVEEKLAALEKGYRGLPESGVYQTTFRVLLLNGGKYEIKVTDQVPLRK